MARSVGGNLKARQDDSCADLCAPAQRASLHVRTTFRERSFAVAKRPPSRARAAPVSRGRLSGMDRDFVEMALAQAGRHVAQGEVILARQRAMITAWERNGRNVALCKEFLSVFEDSQRWHIADRDRLRKDFGKSLADLKARSGLPTLLAQVDHRSLQSVAAPSRGSRMTSPALSRAASMLRVLARAPFPWARQMARTVIHSPGSRIVRIVSRSVMAHRRVTGRPTKGGH